MKHIVFGLVSGCMTILFVVTLLTLMNRNVRREELENSLAEAMETAMLERYARGWEEKGLEEQLVQYLMGQIESDSEVTVEILVADEEKGLLSVKAVECFRYLTGQEGKVECMRTILADREEQETEQQAARQHTVRFYLSREDMEQGKASYKQMVLWHGDCLIRPGEPVLPEGEDKTFVEWRDAGDYLADFSQCVEEDLCYYAVFE